MVVTVLVVLLAFVGLVWFVTYERKVIASHDAQRRDLRLKNLDDLTVENQKILTNYRWIDKGKGIVAIPIERAMELVIPDLSANHPHAAGPITPPVPSPTPSVPGSPAQKPVSAPPPAGNQPSPSPTGEAPSGTPTKP